ncbi:hypothetical protein BSKO_12604 [Bryopsis sp. KO-2023]|nr:hypothetical protein BSKO_12604 [Bryopsis sp. KO-2023]
MNMRLGSGVKFGVRGGGLCSGAFVNRCKAPSYQRSVSKRHIVSCNGDPEKSSRGINFLEWSGKLVPQGPIVSGVKSGWKLAWQVMMQELAPQSKDGAFLRAKYAFGGKIGDPAFPVVPGRYHAYVGNACPWCHRVLLAIAIRGLEGSISHSYVMDDPERASRGGWVFDTPDPNFNCRDLREVYDVCSPGYTGRCTAPLLVDTVNKSAVCNESSIITRNLCLSDMPGSNAVDLYPSHLADEIEAMNEKIYDNVNNGVYRSGFATTQSAYDLAQNQLYSTLDELEARLGETRFILGDKFTETDLRLYPTIIRFDVAYATIFKCSKRRISDYPNLQGWLRDVYQLEMPGQSLQIGDTFDADDARRSYSELFPLNPGGIVPSGPTLSDLRLDEPANRGPSGVSDVFHMKASVVEA